MQTHDTDDIGPSRGDVSRVFAEMQSKADAGEWPEVERLAAEHDRLLRALMRNPEPDIIPYLKSVQEAQVQLLEHILAVRDELGVEIKHLGRGRKAVAAYR